jgi:hypothetical protein
LKGHIANIFCTKFVPASNDEMVISCAGIICILFFLAFRSPWSLFVTERTIHIHQTNNETNQNNTTKNINAGDAQIRVFSLKQVTNKDVHSLLKFIFLCVRLNQSVDVFLSSRYCSMWNPIVFMIVIKVELKKLFSLNRSSFYQFPRTVQWHVFNSHFINPNKKPWIYMFYFITWLNIQLIHCITEINWYSRKSFVQYYQLRT